MAITRFQDLPSENSPINSENLNGNFDELGVKVGTSVDNNYRTNIIKGLNGNASIVVDGEEIYKQHKIIPITINANYIYNNGIDCNIICYKMGNLVLLVVSTLAFKVGDMPNESTLLSGLPKATDFYTFYLSSSIPGTAPFRAIIGTDGTVKRHYSVDPQYGDSANKQYYGVLMYPTND